MSDAASRWSQTAGVALPEPDSPGASKKSARPPPPQTVRTAKGATFGAGQIRTVGDARDGARNNFPLTELGTAERLVSKHGAEFRFVPGAQIWMIWSDGRWVWDRDGAAVRRLTATLHEDIYLEASGAGPEERFYIDWARKTQSEPTIRRIVSLVSDFPAVRIEMGQIDGNPEVVGLDGGRKVLNLRTTEVRSAEPDDFVSKSLPIEELGNPEKAVRWSAFLNEVFGGDLETIRWLQKYLGYCLTGYVGEHLFVFAHGLGANGKSVLLRLLQFIWGDYARVIQAETLMSQSRPGSGPSPDIVRLAGGRLAIGSEVDEGKPLAEALLKHLTGGDTIVARDLYAKPIEFRPTCKFILAGNHRPAVKGGDHGIWRRIGLLEFKRTFSADERDPHLYEKLVAEGPDILAWIVCGARDYLQRGLGELPTSVVVATQEYKDDQDMLREWFEQRTRPEGSIAAHAAFLDYRAWARDRGHPDITPQAFGRRLTERGLQRRKTRDGAVYIGLSIIGSLL